MSATAIELGSSSVHDSAAVGGCNTPRERMLLQPEDYIGSVDNCTRNLWVVDDTYRRRLVTYVPGLYKIFDDILVYAAENKQHDPTMNSLSVDIDVAECRISVYFNGRGVPIELHPVEGIHMPEMVFQETAGGRNRNGVKMAYLFSTEFAIETVDNRLQRKYKQIFSDNMGKRSEPEITVSLLGANSTRIIFKPDLAKFHMTRLDDDVIALMKKRVCDIAAFLGMTVQVKFNGLMIRPPDSFLDYALTYLRTASEGREEPPKLAWKRFSNQLDVCVSQSDGTFQQISFANKFATTSGGTHVGYVLDQLMTQLVKLISSVFQIKESDVEESEIKKHLWVFVNATVDNPTFSSPTRDALTTPLSSFGSSCELTPLFIEDVYAMFAGEITLSSISSQAKKASKRSALCMTTSSISSQAKKASKRSARRMTPSSISSQAKKASKRSS